MISNSKDQGLQEPGAFLPTPHPPYSSPKGHSYSKSALENLGGWGVVRVEVYTGRDRVR